MAYLSSANVKVYPCAYRGNGYDPEARLTSEKNLTSLINAFGARYYDESTVKDSSFVISWANPKIKFVIGGYIFEADLTGQLTADNIYAHIRVNPRHTPTVGSEATDWTCTSLVDFNSGGIEGTLDDTGSFGGLSIDNSPTAANATSDLHILEKVGNDYTVPSESIARVSSYYVGQANEIPGTGTIYYSPIDVAFRTASLTAGNATVGGTLGVSGAATLASLSVTGNATVGGTLGVTGATTFTGAVTANSTLSVTGATTLSGDTFLNATANKSTTILNGAIVLGLGGSGGTIEANGNAEFRGSQGVKTDKLASTGQEPITLASDLDPSGNIDLGSDTNAFEKVYTKELVGKGAIGSTNDKLTLTGTTYSSNLHVTTQATCNKITMLGGLSGDGTIDLKTNGGKILERDDYKVAGTASITLAGNAIYALTVTTAQNSSVSITMTLPNYHNSNSIGTYGANAAGQLFRVVATEEGSNWKIQCYPSSSSEAISCEWSCICLAHFATN